MSELADKLKSIRAILFDKDGTLIDFERTWFAFSHNMAKWAAGGDEEKARHLMDIGGYDWETKRFRANSVIAAGTVEEMVALWHPDADASAQSALIAHYSQASLEAGPEAAVAIDGLYSALEALQDQGFILGICTNDSEAGALKTAQLLGIDHFFAGFIGYDTASRPKPFADPLIYFAEKVGVELSELAMVGDNSHDMEAAHAAQAGLSIGVLSGNAGADILEPLADIILPSVADIPTLFVS
jgi:phosphoglycolate phosphatase